MIAEFLSTYLLPFSSAFLGAVTAHYGRKKTRLGASLVITIAGLLGAATIEVLWHAPHLLSPRRVGGLLAYPLAFAVPTALTFASAWVWSAPRRARPIWVIAAAIAGILGLAIYPVCGIYLFGVITGDWP